MPASATTTRHTWSKASRHLLLWLALELAAVSALLTLGVGTASAQAPAPKTPFQCEKAFPTGSRGRSKCFNQLPGASCAHPLEVEKLNYFRGDKRYLTASFTEERSGEGTLQHWSWAAKKNVAICPYPNGVVFKVSLVSSTTHCQRIHGEEICSSEYGTKNIPEPTSSHGGSFEYEMPATPPQGGFLVVRGRFIHPPWVHQASLPHPKTRAPVVAVPRRAHAASSPKTPFQCEKAYRAGSRGRSRCFDQLPGANCAHPLELQKAGTTTRGDTRYLTSSFHEEVNSAVTETTLYYSWKPKKGVAICPYPNGVVFKVSLGYRTEPNGREVPVGEYDTKNIHVPTSRHGGSWSYEMATRPITSSYLAIRGYFVHPPWAGRR